MPRRSAALLAALCTFGACSTAQPSIEPSVVLVSEVGTTEFRVMGVPYTSYLEAPGRDLQVRDDAEVWIGSERATLIAADATGLRVSLPSGLAVGRYDLRVMGAGEHRQPAALQVVESVIADGSIDRRVAGDAGVDAVGVVDGGDAGADAATDGAGDAPITVDIGCEGAEMIHCFLFEGNLVDGSGGGMLSGAVDYIEGVRGQAALFDEATGPVTIPDSTDPLPDEATVELWFRVDDINGTRGGLIDQNSILGVFVYPSDTPGVFSLRATSGLRNLRFDDIALGEWHHFVLTVRWNAATGYLDGVRDRSGIPRIQPRTGATVHIGSNSDDGESPLIGAIDDLRVWSREMSAEEAAALYGL